LLEEVDSSGNVLARYTQGAYVDEPLAESRAGTTSYYEQDVLGSVTSLSNATGSVVNNYAYDSYGNLTSSTGTTTNPVRYTGRDFDPETGIYYDRARYYDPSAGRFLSEDPIRFLGGANFYPYVGNSPTNFFDPLGLQTTAPPVSPSAAEVDEALQSIESATAAEEAAAGGGAGLGLATAGLAGLDVGLGVYDYYQFKKLCGAYGWSWCSAKPNRDQNREFEEAVRRIEKHCGFALTKDQRRWLHDEITGGNYTIDEIVQIGIDWFCPEHAVCKVPKTK